MYEDGVAVAERAAEWERFDRDLTAEAKDLLCEMAEAEASVPRDRRQKFFFLQHMNGALLLHPGMDQDRNVIDEDVDLLAHYGLLLPSFTSKGKPMYAIAPIGRQYYEHLRSDEDQRIERIEEVTLRHLETDGFGKRHPAAYTAWKKADDLAWSEDAEDRQSEVGHNCRDALVAFVTGLVERHKPDDVEKDPEKFLNRLGAVFAKREISKDVSEALGGLWRYVTVLTMRQDHKERQKPGGLTVEDGRRVVFLTAMALVEADRFLR